jgi:hypothetical protein
LQKVINELTDEGKFRERQQQIQQDLSRKQLEEKETSWEDGERLAREAREKIEELAGNKNINT